MHSLKHFIVKLMSILPVYEANKLQCNGVVPNPILVDVEIPDRYASLRLAG